MDDSGSLEECEFVEYLGTMRVQARFMKMGIQVDTLDPHGLFAYMDHDNSGEVNVDDFIAALSQLHGGARSTDIVTIKASVLKSSKELRSIRKQVENFESMLPVLIQN